MWNYLGKGHSAASLTDFTQFVQLKRFNSQHKPNQNERTSVVFVMTFFFTFLV